MGPVDKTGATAALGMTGKQRWDWVATQAPSGMVPQGHDWDSWLQSLPEDPNDLEYTRLLRQAKANAASRERLRAEQGSVSADLPQISSGDKGDGKVTPMITGIPGRGPKPPPEPAGGPGSPGTKKLDLEEQAQHRRESAGAPIIQGLPVSVGDVGLKDPENPGAAPDPYVEQWVKDKNLELDKQSAQVAARSGMWVYTGETADPSGGKFYTRSMYVYVDDAEAQIAQFSTAEIKKYQKALGQPETGVLTPALQGKWHDAVQAGQMYARNGKKVELKFIFEQLIASDAMAKAGRGGGGGGGAFGNESGADMVGADYYQAMMQVLGDISGVGGSNG